jgi:hypothetical protein
MSAIKLSTNRPKRVALATLLLPLTSCFSTIAEAAGECDRACLTDIVTQYHDALVAHAPDQLPTADSIRFTEDTVEMELGEGLWRTAERPTDSMSPGPLRDRPPYRMDVLDVQQGTAVTYAVLEEEGAPILHVARLKVVDREVTELETMIVRSRPEGGGIFDPAQLLSQSDTMARVPVAAELESREAAIAIAEHYPAGLRVGSFLEVDAPFAPAAYRLENGRLMAGPGCTIAPGCGNIKSQNIPTYPSMYRVIAVDESLGIVVLRQNFGPRPYDDTIELHTWHAFKIYEGQIHAVEAFQNVAPTGTSSGWD